MVSSFGVVLLFIVGAIAFLGVTLFIGYILRPNRPNEEKLKRYECGEEPVGQSWAQFNMRFYIIALIFLLFDIEIVFIFPWVLIFKDPALMEATGGLWGWFALAELAVFILILGLGLIYAWKKGYLDWELPRKKPVNYDSPIPRSAYGKYLKA